MRDVFLLTLGIVAASVLFALGARVRYAWLGRERRSSGSSFETFRSEVGSRVSPEVCRTVYDHFFDITGEKMPVVASDDLGDVYGIVDDDLFEELRELAEKCRVANPSAEEALLVSTVQDAALLMESLRQAEDGLTERRILNTTFEYASPSQIVWGQEDFVLPVPSGIRSESEVFAAYDGAGQFPGYFGYNWDALLDCLRDFSWIEKRKIVIVHSDVPLLNAPPECRIYLEVLQTALADWSAGPKPNTIPPPADWSPYVEYELRVVFPIEARAKVLDILRK